MGKVADYASYSKTFKGGCSPQQLYRPFPKYHVASLGKTEHPAIKIQNLCSPIFDLCILTG